jgi:hypothetical protein
VTFWQLQGEVEGERGAKQMAVTGDSSYVFEFPLGESNAPFG